jgi:cyclic beta-1,2-glucan synthetase
VHAQGYSRFDGSYRGLATSLTVFVTAEDPVKVCRLNITNQSAQSRRITVVSYVEWALGSTRAGATQNVLTRLDADTGAQFASNPALMDFGSRVAFCDLGGRQQFSSDSRHEFLGRNGSMAAPGGVRSFAEWSERNGRGQDPCCAFAVTLELQPGAAEELVFVLGQAADEATARVLVRKYRALDSGIALARVQARWDDLLGTIQIKTPDRALDLLFNRWLLYQTAGCRVWGRAAFYQAGGAFGFRDQLQDSMALTFCAPGQVRAHLLRSAARQFIEGDVQHWWHPPSGRGVRTHFSDDRVWLPFAAHHYIKTTGDKAVLDEVIAFIEGPALPLDREDAQFVPEISASQASLYEHCARALDVSLKFGVHELPLMGGGDWNDGMNRVGHEGRGESVWLAWFLITTLKQFQPIAAARGDKPRATRWLQSIKQLTRACDAAWDGDWYRRAYFDDGTPLGSAQNTECRIDSLAQSWAVLSGAAQPQRAQQAMSSLKEHLVLRDEGLVLLFEPPFAIAPMDPGYIKGYLPGLRENGGQFTHAAVWVLMAQAALRDTQGVAELLRILNPVRRSATQDGARKYRVEPYVLASDVYSGGELAGRGGWTWYTGAAGWFYRAILEYVLGVRLGAQDLQLVPCVPADWDNFEVSIKLPDIDYLIQMRRGGAGQGSLLFDGARMAADTVPLVRDGQRHVVTLILE